MHLGMICLEVYVDLVISIGYKEKHKDKYMDLNRMAVIVLAAGKGTRMKSQYPKVLHKIAGKPILAHVLDMLKETGFSKTCLVLGNDYEDFLPLCEQYQPINIAVQKKQNGTGDAVASAALSFVDIDPPSYVTCDLVKGRPFDASHVLICYGDVPAITADLMHGFIQSYIDSAADLSVLGMDVPNPVGYGRLLIGSQQQVKAIIEDKDATPEQKKITVCNSGIVLAKTKTLFDLLKLLTTDNAQKEYYLTDCFSLASKKGLKVTTFITKDWLSFSGINDRVQLADVEKMMITRMMTGFMRHGVTFHLPETIYIESEIVIGADTVIEPHVVLKGKTNIGTNVYIGAHAVIENVVVRNDARIEAGSVLKNCKI